jgi:hypothetical protein
LWHLAATSRFAGFSIYTLILALEILLFSTICIQDDKTICHLLQSAIIASHLFGSNGGFKVAFRLSINIFFWPPVLLLPCASSTKRSFTCKSLIHHSHK